MTDTPESRTKTVFTVTSGSNDGGLERRVEPMTDAPPPIDTPEPRPCCCRPMITARAYPAGSYYDYEKKATVTPMITEWRCINCGAGGVNP